MLPRPTTERQCKGSSQNIGSYPVLMRAHRAGAEPTCPNSIVATRPRHAAAEIALIVAPACPMLPACDRYEMRTDIDVDMVHVGIGHGAAIVVIGDQPFDN